MLLSAPAPAHPRARCQGTPPAAGSRKRQRRAGRFPREARHAPRPFGAPRTGGAGGEHAYGSTGMSESARISSSATAWDGMAREYDGDRGHDPVYVACVRQAVADLEPCGRVLDCGCGTGLATPYLHAAERIDALDFSARMLEVVQAKFPGHRVRTRQGDVRALPYADRSFDRVLVANVLQHLVPADQLRAAAEIRRVLKPGGRYAVTVHHFSLTKQRAHWKKQGRPGSHDGCDYIFRYTCEELAALFPNARIRAVGFYRWPARSQLLLTRLAGHWLARRGHGHMLCAYGTR